MYKCVSFEKIWQANGVERACHVSGVRVALIIEFFRRLAIPSKAYLLYSMCAFLTCCNVLFLGRFKGVVSKC